MAETEQPAAPSEAPVDSRSIQDRIADKFLGSEPDAPEEVPAPAETAEVADPSEGTESEPEATTEQIEYEGSTYTVPKELKDAFMAKSDYTRKSQETANRARELEARDAQLRIAQSERQFIDSIISETQTISLIDARRREMFDNWASLTADQKQDVHYLDQQRADIARTIESKRNDFLRNQESAIAELQTKAREAVAKAIPGWNDTVKNEIVSHAKSEGYSEQELASIVDPRHAKTMWKAYQFDKIQAQAKSVIKASPVAKAAPAKTMPQETRNMLNFRKATTTHAPNSPEFKAALQERIAQKFGG